LSVVVANKKKLHPSFRVMLFIRAQRRLAKVCWCWKVCSRREARAQASTRFASRSGLQRLFNINMPQLD